MNYLFWNTNQKHVNNVLKELILGLKCDIIGLAEYTDDIQELINELWIEGYYLYHVPQIGCDRIQILTKFEASTIKHFGEQSYYTVKKIPHDKYGDHIVAFVHLSSKLDAEAEDNIVQLADLKASIEQAEAILDNKRTIIMGDFNMNPFERPMVGALGLHALSCRQVTSRKHRVIKRQTYSMFYNPMWNMLGDYNKPQGTYYYSCAKQVNYFWNTFDQVLVRPELMTEIDINEIKIINEIDGKKLGNNNGRPKVSDHFPLYFRLGGIE